MKKAVKRALSACCACALCLAVGIAAAACGETSEATFWGTYYFYSLTDSEGNTYYVGDSYDGVTFTKDLCVFVVDEDGTWTMTMGDDEESLNSSGTWTDDGTSYELEREGYSFSVTWDGNKTLSVPLGDSVTGYPVMTLVKD